MAAPVSFVPQSLDVRLYAGDPAALRLEVTGADAAAYPLDGGVVEAQIRRTRDGELVESFEVDLTDAAAGVILLGLTGEQTAELVATVKRVFVGDWDCQYTPGTGDPLTLVQGRISCARDVTRNEVP